MTHKYFPLATAVVATAILSSTFVLAQSAPASSSAASPIAKPSPYPNPYEGVSTPPADDAILTSDETTAPAPPVIPVTAQAAVAAASSTAVAAPQNPDSMIVETSVIPDDSAVVSLQNRASADSYPASGNPDADIVTDVPAPPNALAGGTTFRVRMLQDVLAEDTQPGTPFRAQLTQDLVRDGRIVIPIGSELRGKIVYATSGRRISGRSVIHLRADEFVLPDGTRYRLHAQVIDTMGSDTKASGEGNIVPQEHAKRAVIVLAAGSGVGAAVGASVGGGVGAVVGTAVGAGIVTTHWLLAERSAEIPAQSTVVFSLTDPLLLTPALN